MRRTLFLTCLSLTLSVLVVCRVQRASAQDLEGEENESADSDLGEETGALPSDDEAAVDDEAAEGETESSDTTLRPPTLTPMTAPPPAVNEPEPEVEAELDAAGDLEGEPVLPHPDEAAKLLEQGGEEADVGRPRWTLPVPVFALHGYFRVRANLMRKLALGRPASNDRLSITTEDGASRSNVDPFDAYRPLDSSPFRGGDLEGNTVAGGCGKSPGGDGRCDRPLQLSSDLRLRLKPEVALSDDVRVKMWIDVFDNVVFGGAGRDPAGRIDLSDTITARRAWAEVRDRDLGELRFGRMGADWGLGILDNGGDRNGIDSDFSSDVDRIMGITNLGGFYLMGAYDWAAQGQFVPGSASPSGVPIDRAQKDDLNEVTVAVARRSAPEIQEERLAQGKSVWNAGLYFIWRKQLIRASSEDSLLPFERIDEKQYIPDLWLQWLWKGLRVELEAAFVAGTLENGCPRLLAPGRTTAERNRSAADSSSLGELAGLEGGSCKLRQLGAALEVEYRLIDDRLGVHFDGGFASGDRHSYGLAATNDNRQRVGDDQARGQDTVSTFAFHPDYRVDLILWRSIMRRVAGAYYFKPGVSFDFLRNPFGRRLGGNFNLIYSRASSSPQTWGGSGNLGVELDMSLYYRSEDGPDPLDGFYGALDVGLLFPLQGLRTVGESRDGDLALMFRSVLGVAF